MGQTAIDGVEGLQETGELDGLHDLRQLMWGHSLLLVCAVLYLIWWCIFCGCCGDACIDRKYGQSSLRTSPHTEKCRGLPRLSEVSHCC